MKVSDHFHEERGNVQLYFHISFFLLIDLRRHKSVKSKPYTSEEFRENPLWRKGWTYKTTPFFIENKGRFWGVLCWIVSPNLLRMLLAAFQIPAVHSRFNVYRICCSKPGDVFSGLPQYNSQQSFNLVCVLNLNKSSRLQQPGYKIMFTL